MNSYTLTQTAVLMRFSAGSPGKSRKDKRTSAQVQTEKGISKDGGKWVANLYPDGALKEIEQLIGQARKYHDKVTLPFGAREEEGEGQDGAEASKRAPVTGVGVLPAALIMEYGDTMRVFQSKLARLVDDTFLANPQQWVDWAKTAHNGTFDPKNYPGCTEDSFDADVFRSKMRGRFYVRTEPMPVPNASHFNDTVAQLLGTDAEAVNMRVADAEVEARRELMRRLIEPVKAMAAKLTEQPKLGKDGQPKADVIFRDTLVENIREIAGLGPKLNISGDSTIDGFCREMAALTVHTAEDLRDDKGKRATVAGEAEALLKRLEGYRI
jgi:hypothetical protein